MRYAFVLVLISVCCSFCATDDHNSSPKPRQFPKIEFPAKIYTEVNFLVCPFGFDLPKYAHYVRKEQIFNESLKSQCWFNLIFPSFDAQIYLSYYPIDTEHTLPELIDDSYTMASKHNVKATSRAEIPFKNSFGSQGIIFKIGGHIASPYQFYVTDNENHFLRGSFYYQEVPDQDSIAPVTDFLFEDIERILSSITWK